MLHSITEVSRVRREKLPPKVSNKTFPLSIHSFIAQVRRARPNVPHFLFVDIHELTNTFRSAAKIAMGRHESLRRVLVELS